MSTASLSDADRAYAEARLGSGLVLARVGERPEVLRGCSAPIGYVYEPARPRDAVERSGSVELSTHVVGRYRAGRPVDVLDWFEGACDGATHYVAAAAVGAFEGGEALTPEPRALRGGSLDACARAISDDVPPPGCAAIVRLELRPLPHKPCPRYSVLRDGVCRADAEGVAPPNREPFQVSQQGALPPGLVPGQVEEFVRPRERDVDRACFRGKFSQFTSATVEWALSVDPGGNVFPSGRDGKPSEPAVQLRRGEAREGSPELGRCVERVVSSWRFPRATTPTWLLLRFDLTGQS